MSEATKQASHVHNWLMFFFIFFILMFQAAYVAVMQTVNASNRSGYESLLRIYRETDLSQEKTRVLSKSHIIFL